MKTNYIKCCDCLDGMKELPDECVDLVCTDPPYQLSSITKQRNDPIAVEGHDGSGNPFCRSQAKRGFMSKSWDVLPPVEVWKEMLRVMKSGAFAFIMTTPRQDNLCQLLMDLTKAGFNMSFSSLYWCYASGFNKSMNISKMIDKRACKKELTKKLERKPTKEEMKESWEIRKKGKIGVGKVYEYIPKTPQAKALDGSYAGFQPKPAVEVILVCMKPLSEKTFVDQALKNKKGITWLDDGRTPYESEDDMETSQQLGQSFGGKSFNTGRYNFNVKHSFVRDENWIPEKGRFPANFLVSDDVLNDGKKHTSADLTGQLGTRGNVYGEYDRSKPIFLKGNNVSSFSRYFSLDSWWQDKIKNLPKNVQKTFPFLIVPKTSRSEKNKGLEEIYKTRKCRRNNAGVWQNLETKQYDNIHPTIKPLLLMSYLITIASRKNDIILDPFMGSGTTALACKMNARQYIGFEKEKEYCEIANKRVNSFPVSLTKFIGG